MKILFLSAFSQEIAHFKDMVGDKKIKLPIDRLMVDYQLYRGHELYFASTGMGTVFAGMVTTLLTHTIKPDLIIFAGTAGGVASSLQIGDLVVANAAVDIDMYTSYHHFQNTPFAHALIHPLKQQLVPTIYAVNEALVWVKKIQPINKITVHLGCVASSNYFPAPTFIFKTIKELQALSIDMESSAIYQTGWLLGVNTLVIRAISNLLDDQGHDANIQAAKIDTCAENLAQYMMQLLDTLPSVIEKENQYALSNSQ